VSEAGFMMDNETLQKLIGHFVEMRNKIDGVTAGQEGLKNDMKSEMSAVKNISAVTDNISAIKTTSAL
jgi:hypothetical protein